MDDWRYETLREDVGRLRKELNEVEQRTWKVEHWQSLQPFRVWMAIWWLVIAGIWIAEIAIAAGAFSP
jgi:hypothetical protein